MHDIDRTRLETQPLGPAGELEEFGETGYELLEAPLTEVQEIELASELLEISSEEELEQFLGNLFSTVGNTAGRFIRSDTGRALGGILKNAAKQALPLVGRAAGQWVSPDGGGAVGARLATQAGSLFGLELEGLSAEDREFEVARQFVRFAGAATQQATQAQPGTAPAVARSAATAAARAHAPGLLPRLQGRSGALWPRSGRWVRRGRTIVLYGS